MKYTYSLYFQLFYSIACHLSFYIYISLTFSSLINSYMSFAFSFVACSLIYVTLIVITFFLNRTTCSSASLTSVHFLATVPLTFTRHLSLIYFANVRFFIILYN